MRRLLPLLVAGCGSGVIDNPFTNADDEVVPDGFTLAGEVVPVGGTTRAGCIDLYDPTQRALGGQAELLATGEVVSGGFSLGGIVTLSVAGLQWTLRDCGGEGAWYPSTTTVGSDAYADLGPGDVLAAPPSLVLYQPYAETLAADALTAGYDGALLQDGFLFGQTLDAGATALSGVSVTCPGCPLVLYEDDDPSDGRFTTGGVVNTATGSTGVFVVPAAPEGAYTADGFATVEAAATPGEAAVLRWVAE
jgi:hypothetical protein